MGNKNQKSASQSVHGGDGKHRQNLSLVPTDFFVRQVGHHGLPHGTRTIAYSEKQQLLAVGTDIGLVKTFGSYSGVEATFVDPMCKSAVTSILFSHSGSTLIVVHANTAIRLFDLKKQCKRGEIKPGWTADMISAVHLCPEEAKAPFLYVGTDDGSLHVLNLLKMEFTEYKISAAEFDIVLSDDDSYDEIVGIESNPQDFNEVLIAHEFHGVSLWNISKHQRLKRFVTPKEILSRGCRYSTMSERGSFSGQQRPSIASISWHPCGTDHFVVGFANGSLVMYDSSHKNSGKIQEIHYEEIAMPTRLTSVQWLADMKGAKGPGHLIVSGGHETCGVTILYRNPLYKKSHGTSDWIVGDVAMPMTADGPVSSLLLPTWDSSPVMKLVVTYPKGLAPKEVQNMPQESLQELGIGSHHPSGYILLSGDPQDGIHPRLYIQALPSNLGNVEAKWPPIASDPPEPTPQIMHFPSPLRRSMVVLVQDCGLCPEEVINAIKSARSVTHYPQSWKYPVSGGSYQSSSKRRSLVATGHVDGTLCLWAASPPTDGVSIDLEEDGVINTPFDLLYEFEPSLLCQAEGYKAPQRPALTSMELHLPSRLLCLGTESGDVIVCAVRPNPKSWNGGNISKSQNDKDDSSGSAVFLLHCIQGVHSSRIVGVSLHAETGLLAIADSSGKCTILDIETGALHDVEVPGRQNLVFGEKSYRNNGPVRSLSTANVPVYEHNDVVGYVACAIFGMADASIAVCNLLNGESQLVLVPAGCEDPITNMLIIDQNGIAPIPRGPCKRISKVFESPPPLKSRDVSNVEDGNSDLASKLDQVGAAGLGNEVPSKKSESDVQDSASKSNLQHNAAGKGDDVESGESSKDRKQTKHRFIVAVAGHETFVVGLKLENLTIKEHSKQRKLFVKVKPLAHANLDSTSVSSSAAVVVGNSDGKDIRTSRCLICVDNMNNATILALPRLQRISKETLPTVGMSEYLRHVSIMDCGDIFLVTELSVLHRLAITSMPTLGFGTGPSLLNISAAGNVKVQRANKPKKSTVFSMFGGGKTEVDLNKIFNISSKSRKEKQDTNSLLGPVEEGKTIDNLDNGNKDGISTTTKMQGELAGVGNVMNENMRKLEERGEQLNNLQEATSKMMLNAMRFEEESRRIRKQAEKDSECTIS